MSTGMSTIIQRIPSEDFPAWVRISANAYPGWGVTGEEELSRVAERMRAQAEENPDVVHYGCYRDGVLLGGMRSYDYEMNTRGVMLPAGGIGSVAVDLAHKKEKVARDLVQFFIRHFRERGVPITLLYPFRPDFYLDMGYGYGTKMSRYRFKPAALPAGGDRSRVRFAGRDDQEQIVACYNRFAGRRHGMIRKAHYELSGMFGPTQRIVAYWDGGAGSDGATVRGYLRFTFKQRTPENPILNDLVVAELIYETPAALAGLLAFLRSQADQVDRIALTTLDDSFYHLLSDPRDGGEALIPPVYHESEVAGVGLMYRVSDVPAVFRLLAGAGHDFGGQSCKLRLAVRDTFVPENDGAVLLRFVQGRATVLEGSGASVQADVEARLDVARFSSLLMGSVTFERLYAYGLAEVSDAAYVPALDRLFRTAEKPMCVTPF